MAVRAVSRQTKCREDAEIEVSDRSLMIETRAAAILKGLLQQVTDDQDTLADCIEGATSLHEAIHRVVKDIMEYKILSDGIANAIGTLQDRAKRIEHRMARRRNAIQLAMEAGELQKKEYPEATISLRRVPPGLEVTDEAAIPQKYWEEQKPTLNKSLLKEDLKANIEISGAHLNNGGVTLSVSRK